MQRLALGQAERLTVLTPNLRLAQVLEVEADRRQTQAGAALWEASDILAFDHFLRRCHEEASYAPAGAELPALLSEAAEGLQWEEVVKASRWRDTLLSPQAAAGLAAEAWALAHAYRIEGALASELAAEDALAFTQWAKDFEARTQRLEVIDAARLPRLVAQLLADGSVARPATLVLYAFDRVTPQQRDFLAACERLGIAVRHCSPAGVDGRVRRLIAASPREELEMAARWARAQLEAETVDGVVPRIAIVVPDLAQRQREVRRVLGRTFGPATGSEATPLFNLSLGEPLSAWPIVDAALGIIQLACGAAPFALASRLLRSPFIAGSVAEEAARARLDAAWRRVAPASVTLPRLLQLISHAERRVAAPACPRLIAALDRLLTVAREDSGAKLPCDWSRRFTQMLEVMGFPGERPLDSAEFQAFTRWSEALSELSALTPYTAGWPAGEALSRLGRMCEEILFQPRSGTAPVQVLGLLESVGLEFERLWVCGLEESTWPLPARPHPLLSPALQRRAGIPQSSAETALAVDQQITRAWQRAAPEVIFSNAHADGDREMLASPLIASFPLATAADVAIPEFTERRRLLQQQARQAFLAPVEDDRGPGVGSVEAQGGTGILVDQAACPFRAFAHYRLDARALESPGPGLAPPERGTLLHTLMAHLWEQLKDSATLQATDSATRERLVREAAAHAVQRMREDRPGRLEERFAQLEEERLAAIALQWLTIEAARPAFSVHMREEKFRLEAGPLLLNGRIDRVDRLADGSFAVLDYKSGEVAVARWMGERPEDAQLPLYALAVGESQVSVIAFAKLKAGDRGFTGIARDAQALPPVLALDKQRGLAKHAGTWEELLAGWRHEVGALGEGFAQGAAQVDPKALLSTCRWCDLKPLCRVHERLTPLDEGDEDESREDES